MNESYQVSSKYYYRVAVTAKVYNSSGSLVESKTSFLAKSTINNKSL